MARRRSAVGVLATVPALPALLVSGCTTEPDPHPALSVTYFPAAISGDLRVTLGGEPGTSTRLDLVEDLDLDPEDQVELGASIDLYGIRYALAWLPLSFSGKEQLQEDEIFHGTTFPAGSRVESDFELPTWRLRIDAPLFEKGASSLRAGGGLYWWDLDLRLHDVDTGVTDERSFSRLLPSVNTSGYLDLGRNFGTGFEAAFAAIDANHRVVDVAGLLRGHVGPSFSATAGWRWIRYVLDEDTNVGTIDVFGPTFTMEWRF